MCFSVSLFFTATVKLCVRFCFQTRVSSNSVQWCFVGPGPGTKTETTYIKIKKKEKNTNCTATTLHRLIHLFTMTMIFFLRGGGGRVGWGGGVLTASYICVHTACNRNRDTALSTLPYLFSGNMYNIALPGNRQHVWLILQTTGTTQGNNCWPMLIVRLYTYIYTHTHIYMYIYIYIILYIYIYIYNIYLYIYYIYI